MIYFVEALIVNITMIPVSTSTQTKLKRHCLGKGGLNKCHSFLNIVYVIDNLQPTGRKLEPSFQL